MTDPGDENDVKPKSERIDLQSIEVLELLIDALSCRADELWIQLRQNWSDKDKQDFKKEIDLAYRLRSQCERDLMDLRP